MLKYMLSIIYLLEIYILLLENIFSTYNKIIVKDVIFQ